jgi:hypothetical protein
MVGRGLEDLWVDGSALRSGTYGREERKRRVRLRDEEKNFWVRMMGFGNGWGIWLTAESW